MKRNEWKSFYFIKRITVLRDTHRVQRRLCYFFLTFASRSVRTPHLSYRAILYYYLLHLHEPSRDGKACKPAHEWRRRRKHLNLKGSKFGVLSGPKKKFAVFSRPTSRIGRVFAWEKCSTILSITHSRRAVELARILENSLRGSSVTMNFSDRCDTVHVFHSHQNGRTARSDEVPLTRDVFDPFLFFLSNFSLIRSWLVSTFPGLTMLRGRLSLPEITRCATNRLKFTTRPHKATTRDR